MKRAFVLAVLFALAMVAASARADYPKPSMYPISWELKFEHSMPKRIVVNLPGGPRAYYYLVYTVTNSSDQEQMFFPVMEMLTEDGRVIRSDKNVPLKVFDLIKARESKQFLEQFPQIEGSVRLGEDQARDGVAIWSEPTPEMGRFSIFIGGLSGEATTIKGPDGKPMTLRKTLELNYLVRGDEVYPGEDEVNEEASRWVMR